MNVIQWKKALLDRRLDGELTALYAAADAPRTRYLSLVDDYVNRWGEADAVFVSVPGRTEICGNHTDHQRGRVLCAGVTMDTAALAAPADDGRVVLLSRGFGEIDLALDDLSVRAEERGTSAAILRGVAAAFRERGLAVGGFRAVCVSDVLAGGGLSSSAAFEILAGAVFDRFYNGGASSPMELAKMGQYAERAYFGKPSGLMDQAACALGGIAMIDFLDPDDPAVEPIDFEFRSHGYVLCAVDTRTSHADLTADYAAITADMFAAARAAGAADLRGADAAAVAGAKGLTLSQRDRAAHFFAENERVLRMADALRQGDMAGVLAVMNESGRSSRELLRNVVPASHPERIGMAEALDRAEAFLRGRGAWRIHGGGFAGCIQCLVPAEDFERFRAYMDGFYGGGACFELRIRPCGVCFPGAGAESD